MKFTAEQVKEALYDVGAKVYDDYSGRNMYGDECPGFETETDGEAFQVFVKLAGYITEMAQELAKSARTDSMGRGMIVYFPSHCYKKKAA